MSKHTPHLLAPLGLAAALALSACAQNPSAPADPSGRTDTVRICDDSGCSWRPRNSASFNPAASVNPEQERRMALLRQQAEADPRAAYDLGLRYYRGDGVEQNSYQALQWMRSAGERGDVRAQAALGRFYLMGVEEMGSDPAEAEKWLDMAAARGDKESAKLLKEARAAKKREADLREWIATHRALWQNYWLSGYGYRSYWSNDVWLYY